MSSSTTGMLGMLRHDLQQKQIEIKNLKKNQDLSENSINDTSQTKYADIDPFFEEEFDDELLQINVEELKEVSQRHITSIDEDCEKCKAQLEEVSCFRQIIGVPGSKMDFLPKLAILRRYYEEATESIREA
ncbi:20639_t:CDS:2 [Gigaspora margarita]|uniref:20639_t:CDS:1 n=1 Tax=Gigaspora margarita TaxID=4874 RepID=A0ABN7UXD2_GIGMA|nr:20639_t:CDS:2 [Gigaspora margarita]